MDNIIYAQCNFSSKQWLITNDKLCSGEATIKINFSYDNSETFTGLTYGVDIYEENTLIKSEQWPTARIKVETLLQSYQVETPVRFEQEKNIKMRFWAKINDEEIINEITINGLKPPQPYPSWVWKNHDWHPPKPRPERGITFWNEARKTWVNVDDEYMPDAAGSRKNNDPI